MRISFLGLATLYGPLVAATSGKPIYSTEAIPKIADAAGTVGTGNLQEERTGFRLKQVGVETKRVQALPPWRQGIAAVYNFLEQHVGEDLASQYIESHVVRLQIFQELQAHGVYPSDMQAHFQNTEFDFQTRPEYMPAAFHRIWEDVVRNGRLRKR